MLIKILSDGRPAAGPREQLVFDLDDTLLDTRYRKRAILQHFAASMLGTGEIPRSDLQILAGLDHGAIRFRISHTLEESGISDPVVIKKAARFWVQRNFTSSWLREDQPFPGAVAYVRRAHATGMNIVYLTGRSEPEMGEGTLASLRRHGFPMGDHTRLMMKPSADLADLGFKQSAIEAINRLGPVRAAFENEPVNLNMMARSWPEATIFFMESLHSPDAPDVDARAVRIRSFET